MIVKINSVHVIYEENSHGLEPVGVILKAGRFPVVYRLEDMSADEIGDLIETKSLGRVVEAKKP